MPRPGRRLTELESEIKARVTQTEREAYEKGYAEGHGKGYDEGKAEVARLVESLHTIITKAIEKRNEIIEEAETQIINLVLLIVKKVIKVISENQKNVVINNVVQALRKLKSRGDVVIRVNLADLELTSEHVKDFMKMVENVKSHHGAGGLLGGPGRVHHRDGLRPDRRPHLLPAARDRGAHPRAHADPFQGRIGGPHGRLRQVHRAA